MKNKTCKGNEETVKLALTLRCTFASATVMQTFGGPEGMLFSSVFPQTEHSSCKDFFITVQDHFLVLQLLSVYCVSPPPCLHHNQWLLSLIIYLTDWNILRWFIVVTQRTNAKAITLRGASYTVVSKCGFIIRKILTMVIAVRQF